jgi:hypothetical protein
VKQLFHSSKQLKKVVESVFSDLRIKFDKKIDVAEFIEIPHNQRAKNIKPRYVIPAA